jgi:hypothetical protein
MALLKPQVDFDRMTLIGSDLFEVGRDGKSFLIITLHDGFQFFQAQIDALCTCFGN